MEHRSMLDLIITLCCSDAIGMKLWYEFEFESSSRWLWVPFDNDGEEVSM